jgi:hypothetical protein
VVVVFRMSAQAENTIRSFCAGYQRNVAESDYEVIVVENASTDVLGEERALSLGGNVRYFLRDEPGTSPGPALDFGVSRARAARVGLVIDGARLVTPRVVEYALLAGRMDPASLVVVPGYHLGPTEQQKNPGYDEAAERALLRGIEWPSNGYRLFEISTLSSANRHGVFHPFMESNCVFCPKASYEAIGGADPRFDLPGGGSVNLYLYRKLAMLPASRLVVLPGEGSFHQFHGGVTTTHPGPRLGPRLGPGEESLDEVLAAHKSQLASILGAPFEAPKREPMLLGAVTSFAQPQLAFSSERALARFRRFRAQGLLAWSDDDNPTE